MSFHMPIICSLHEEIMLFKLVDLFLVEIICHSEEGKKIKLSIGEISQSRGSSPMHLDTSQKLQLFTSNIRMGDMRDLCYFNCGMVDGARCAFHCTSQITLSLIHMFVVKMS